MTASGADAFTEAVQSEDEGGAVLSIALQDPAGPALSMSSYNSSIKIDELSYTQGHGQPTMHALLACRAKTSFLQLPSHSHSTASDA